jgi:phosphate transport system permease protein
MSPRPTPRADRLAVGLTLFGALLPCAVVGFLATMPVIGASFFEEAPISTLLALRWRAATGDFGMFPLFVGTVVCASIATGLSIMLGTLAAMHIASRARPVERRIGEASIASMAALPSVVVGLIGLDILVPVFGFSAATAIPTLTLMILPMVALLALGALREALDELREQARALGYHEHQIKWNLAVRAAGGRLFNCGLLGLVRACGEATAVSMVAGNPPSGLWTGLGAPARTATSTILIEHGGATGSHEAALFIAATWLAVLVIALTACGRILLWRTKK